MDDDGKTYWYECPKCGPVDPVRTPRRLVFIPQRGLEPEWVYLCPNCDADVEVKSS